MSQDSSSSSADHLPAWSALLEPGARELLERAGQIEDPAQVEPKHLAWLREVGSPELVAAAMELAQARRKGAAKFEHAQEMWMDLAGIEQASAEDVARWKARRFEERDERIWDLCCGIGGDAMALAAVTGDLVAVDSDPLACLMAECNLGLSRGAGVSKDLVEVRCAPVEDLLASSDLDDALVHIDPARRRVGSHSGRGGRSWRFEDTQPGPEVLAEIIRVSRGAAIKLGPGVELDELPHAAESEIELMASRGGLKQVLLWTGELAEAPGLRRASRVEKGLSFAAMTQPMPRHRSEPSDYLYIPDPALERAGLVGARLAALDQEVWNLHPGLGYLHGPLELRDPWFSCYRIETVLPWREKKLRSWLTTHGVGKVEVRTRGGAVVVEKARRELRGDGDQSYVIFGLRLGKRILAFVTRALDPGAETPG